MFHHAPGWPAGNVVLPRLRAPLAEADRMNKWQVMFGRPGQIPVRSPNGTIWRLTPQEAKDLARELLAEVEVWAAKEAREAIIDEVSQ